MGSRVARGVVAVLAALAVGGCYHPWVLMPGPGAQQVPGEPRAASQAVSGVQVTVSGTAWTGSSAIYQLLTPVQVAVVNQSGRPLRIRYELFALAGPTGFKLNPVSPYELADSGQGQLAPGYPVGAFYPQYHGYYPGPPWWGPWWGPWPYDPFYSPYYYWPYQLPTQDILEAALPEGVVDDGGQVTGFLYFQRLTGRWTQVSFQVNLVDASTGESFGTVAIPFLIVR
ncbi:MAG: hypothetical protein ACYC8T_03760 [Myxococcaceae bacterium]